MTRSHGPSSALGESERPRAQEPVGVVLAGGQSRRMGHDKSKIALPFGEDVTLLQWAADRISSICDDWVVADGGQGLLEDAISLADGVGSGPVAGLLGAADRYPGRPLLVLACDLPLIPAAFLSHLSTRVGDWVVPITAQGPEPLCALYRFRAIEALRLRADFGRWSLRDLGEGDPTLEIHRIWSQDLLTASFLAQRPTLKPDAFFSNLNRPQDLDWLKEESVGAALRQEDFLRVDSTRG